MYFSTAVVLSVSAVALALPLRSTRPQRRALADTGICGLPEIEFIDDQDVSLFNAADQESFPHAPDSNFTVIADFVCSQLELHCDAPPATVELCQNATAMAEGLADKGGAAADAFNAVLQIATDFAAVVNSDSNDNSQNNDQNNVGNSQSNNNQNNAQSASSSLDLGSCGSPEIQFANGLDGRKEPSFQAINQGDFNHGSALNIGVITSFICGQLQSKCKAASATVDACNAAAAAAAKQTGGAAADTFNSAFGIQSNFASVQARDLVSLYKMAALDTGSCGSPEIEFANGLDGRKEPSFQAVNQADFNHGSALNIGVISNFICGQLSSKCKASAATVSACQQAASAASGQKGGAAADAFNAALGITSNFAAVKATRELSERAGGNLQKFGGNLGASPPAVTSSGDGNFQVDGNAAFNSLQNALVRDVQHNKCANAANASGNKGALSVQACQTQQDQCNALARS